MKSIFKRVIIIVVLFIIAVLLSYGKYSSLSNMHIDYCKQLIKYQNGFAGINEGDRLSQIFVVSEDGELKEAAVLSNKSYLKGTVSSVEKIFQADEVLYALIHVYGGDGREAYYLGRCDFTKGVVKNVLKLALPEEYNVIIGDYPYITEGKLNMCLVNRDSNVLAAFEWDLVSGERNAAGCIELPDTFYTEKCQVTSRGIFYMNGEDGVFLDNQKLYPLDDEKTLVDSMYYNETSGTLNFLDLDKGLHISYGITDTGADRMSILSSDDVSFVSFEYLQNMRTYDNGVITASIECAEGLNGYFYNAGEDTILENIRGKIDKNIFLFQFCITFSIELLIYAVLALILLLVGKIGIKSVLGGDRVLNTGLHHYVSLQFKIMLSVFIIIIFIDAVIGIRLGNMVIEQNQHYSYLNQMQKAKNIAGYLYDLQEYADASLIEADGETMRFENDAYSRLKECIADINSMNNDYEFAVFSTLFFGEDNSTWCIYSNEYQGARPAEYAISLKALEVCKSVTLSSPAYFDDKRTIGKIRYCFAPSIVYDIYTDDIYHIVVAVYINTYKVEAEQMQMLPQIWIAIAGISLFLFFVIAGIVKLLMRKLNILSRGLIEYNRSGDTSMLVIKGRDEIAQSAEALHGLAEALKIQLGDIKRGNRYYSRFLPKKLLPVFGKQRVTQIKPGEKVRTEAGLMEIKSSKSYTKKKLEELISLLEECDGIVIDFNMHVMRALFISRDKEEEGCKKVNEYINSQKDMEAELSCRHGYVTAGCIGTEERAMFVVVQEAS